MASPSGARPQIDSGMLSLHERPIRPAESTPASSSTSPGLDLPCRWLSALEAERRQSAIGALCQPETSCELPEIALPDHLGAEGERWTGEEDVYNPSNIDRPPVRVREEPSRKRS